MFLNQTLYRSAALCMLACVFLCFASGCSTKNWKAEDWFNQGISQANGGKYSDSISAYTRAIEMDPSYTLAYVNRGYAHASLGNYRRALDDYNKVLSLNDKSIPSRDIHREIGAVYFRMGKPEEAITAWKNGLGKTRDDAGLMNNLAVAYLSLNQVDKAALAAASAYAVDPSMPDVMDAMGQVAMAKKEYQKAADFFSRSIEMDPNMPLRYLNAALAFEKLKQYDDALRYAKQYMEMEKDTGARQAGYELIARVKKAAGR